MPAKAKLELDKLTDTEVSDLTGLIATSMSGNANFTTPSPALTALTAAAGDMDGIVAERDALLQQAQLKTVEIRGARNIVEGLLTAESEYVNGIAANGATPEEQTAVILSAGMAVAASSGTPVGPMPKVTGLTATTGDADGTIDLHWHAIRRGLQNYLVEMTTDPAGLTGWHFQANSRKSSAEITGLTSGTRYWFRVTAEGAAGPGPASDPATKVAP